MVKVISHRSNVYGVRRARGFSLGKKLLPYDNGRHVLYMEKGAWERPLVVKMTSPGLPEEKRSKQIEKLKAEAAVHARLTREPHNAIARYYGEGELLVESAGSRVPVYYLATEYVPGENLWRVYRTIKSRSWFAQVCEGLLFDRFLPLFYGAVLGLSHIHDQECVHGDPKPDNIVGRPGAVKWVDFEFARPAGEFLPGESLGDTYSWTHEYSSERVRRGEAPLPEDDLFSLGASFVQVLTGWLPLAGRDLYHKGLDDYLRLFWKNGVPGMPPKGVELLCRLAGLGSNLKRFTHAAQAASFIQAEFGGLIQ